MRRVNHRSFRPNPLPDSQVAEARRLIADFLSRPEEERAARRAPVDEKVFLSDTVRAALRGLFEDRCAYCESRSSPLSVAHHRPFANAGGGRARLPHHYSWLAYDWENLLLACQACASRKRNLFPLNGGRAPLLTPLSTIRKQEAPRLLDPGHDQPVRHLDFTLDGRCHPRTRRGASTIELLELNREQLVEERRDAFGRFEAGLANENSSRPVLEILEECGDPQTPFSGGQQILRYRLLSSLAGRLNHFEFPFEDAMALAPGVLDLANRDDVRWALETLMRPVDTPPKSVVTPAAHPVTHPIRRIEIENFKAIDHAVIEMAAARENGAASALMLLGENATGKSSVLEAVTLALAGAAIANDLAKARDFRPQRDRGAHPGSHGPTRIRIEFWEGPSAELTIGPDDSFAGTAEPRSNVLAYGSRRYFRPGRRRRARSGGAAGLFDPSWSLPHPDLWLRDLKPEAFPEIARALSVILSLPGGVYLKQSEGLGVVIVDGDLETPLARHSDGYRSLFGTSVDILRGLIGGTDVIDAQGVVLIDEVETHLHPRWKMLVVAALRKALPRVQFIVTTHDPLCLRSMGPGEVQVMARDSNNRIGVVAGLPDVSGMRIDQILTSEHFGMHSTLDPDFQELFDRYYALLREGGDDPDRIAELETLRSKINERQSLGRTERERILLEAIDRNLARRVASGGTDRAAQDGRLKSELDSIWSDGRAGPR